MLWADMWVLLVLESVPAARCESSCGRGPSLFFCVLPASLLLLCVCRVEFGAILLWFFLCDRTNVLWQAEKVRAQVWSDIYRGFAACRVLVAGLQVLDLCWKLRA